MSSRRGKKLNPTKNNQAAREFAEGKRLGRPKQRWIQDVVEITRTDANGGSPFVVIPGSGHWEQVTDVSS